MNRRKESRRASPRAAPVPETSRGMAAGVSCAAPPC